MVVVMRKMKRFDWIILGLLALMFVLIIVDLIVTKDKQMVSNKAFTVLVCIVELVLVAVFFRVSTDYLLGLSDKHTLDTDGLTDLQIAHIQTLINDITDAGK